MESFSDLREAFGVRGACSRFRISGTDTAGKPVAFQTLRAPGRPRTSRGLQTTPPQLALRNARGSSLCTVETIRSSVPSASRVGRS